MVVPNILRLLGLNPQFIYTLDWAYPIMRRSWSVSSGHWRRFNVTLAPNSLAFSSVKVATRQQSLFSKIRIVFPSLWDVFFLTTLMSFSSPKFSTPFSYISCSIYTPLSVGSSWWEDIPYVSGSLHIISLVRGDLFSAVDMTF